MARPSLTSPILSATLLVCSNIPLSQGSYPRQPGRRFSLDFLPSLVVLSPHPKLATTLAGGGSCPGCRQPPRRDLLCQWKLMQPSVFPCKKNNHCNVTLSRMTAEIIASIGGDDDEEDDEDNSKATATSPKTGLFKSLW
ncbi:hypothetical protein RB213_012700, partial [Colletotrichum asianum]